MNKLSAEKRVRVLSALVEGNSVRATCRMTGVAKGTVLKLLGNVGRACARYQDQALRSLPCKRLQTDEIWGFCYSKQANVPEHLQGMFGFGDVWTWVAMCADTKLIAAWKVGPRDARTAEKLMVDLAGRLTNRVQLTTDGNHVYINAVEKAFGDQIDYAMLVKLYSGEPTGNEARYSPAKCCGARKDHIQGQPRRRDVSTSYVERQNLTMRMQMRRLTRLTNAFSKKVENLEHAVALHFMYYNFCRIHQTLRVTPAMEAGIAKHIWTLQDIVLLDK